MNTQGMSLKYKILTALTVLPLIGLTLFLLLAVNIFEEDKMAYIYDSSLSVSKTKGARAHAEISSLISVVQSVVYSYSPDSRTMAESGTYIFNQESKFEAFDLYAISPKQGGYDKAITLSKKSAEGEMFRIDEPDVKDLLRRSLEEKVIVRRPADESRSVLLILRFGEVGDPKHIIGMARFRAVEFSEAFSEEGGFISILAYPDGRTLFGDSVRQGDGGVWSTVDIWKHLASQKSPEGSDEISSPSGGTYLASFVAVGVGDLRVLSLVDKQKALEAVNVLLRQSILFFLALLSFTTIIGVLASSKLTSALRHLLLATKKVAEGQFDVHVTVKARDEIGSLATSFNAMAIEVSRLMEETADKARMESELATARTVQETLFPEAVARIGAVEIAGHYQPASECGGDWWYYCENDGKVYLWIGDATGHGAPAALITSAARAVASVIQSGPAIGPANALALLNRAIYDSSKGKMMMTFFLATIDLATGEMHYANASHEAPLLLKKADGPPSRSDYIPLNDVNNPRLGERFDVEFNEASVRLDPGDRIVFYTDGVIDVKDVERKAWGERKFLKSLSKELHENQDSDRALNGVVQAISDFRQETPLDDDVTLILCAYKGAA